MDNGARFVLDNFEKALNVCNSNKEYSKFIGKIRYEYNIIKYIQTTGNMIEHFDKFIGGKHKHAKSFVFLNDYGILTNEQLSDYLRKNYRSEANNLITYKNLKEKMTMSYAEIYIYFGGQSRGSVIRRNIKKNLFVLTLDDKHNDFKSDKTIIFNYKGANTDYDESRNLLNYKKLKSSIYVFHKIAMNKYEYCGEYDIGAKRFEKDGGKYIELHQKEDNHQSEFINCNFSYMTLNESKDAKYLKEPTQSERMKCKSSYSQRNQKVSSYTKNRAMGKCDLCGKRAPFSNMQGQPYLECHHVIYIANDGPDRIYNTVALCPNCHKEVHELGNLGTKKKMIQRIKDYLTEDNDIDNLERFNKLFGYN